MIRLRATKYDPANRDDDGRYLADEWTSIDDIGSSFRGHTLTESEYLAVEGAYISAIRDLMIASELEVLRIVDIEERTAIQEGCLLNTHVLQQEVGKLSLGSLVVDGRIATLARLALRGVIWCKLHGDNGTYVHFGYDYYMYLGTDLKSASMPEPPNGLFYEVVDSPYSES